MTDDLETILGAKEPGELASRAELLASTTGVVRRKAYVRRAAKALSVLAIFALGSVAGWALKPTEVRTVFVEVEAPPKVVEPPPVVSEQAVVSLDDLEQQAELTNDKAMVAKLYRQAGDRYLSEVRDYRHAARCYRLYLNAAAADERRVAASDSWLLISMKTQTPE